MGATTTNPHWRGDYPAWDIVLSNGEVHKSVTEVEIRAAIRELERLGLVDIYTSYVDVVRQGHIDLYDKYYTEVK